MGKRTVRQTMTEIKFKKEKYGKDVFHRMYRSVHIFQRKKKYNYYAF